MKIVRYKIVILIIFSLYACEKLSLDDSPGNIPGMGNNNDRLTIK